MAEDRQNCGRCNGDGQISVKKQKVTENPDGSFSTSTYMDRVDCPTCKGKGYLPGSTR